MKQLLFSVPIHSNNARCCCSTTQYKPTHMFIHFMCAPASRVRCFSSLLLLVFCCYCLLFTAHSVEAASTTAATASTGSSSSNSAIEHIHTYTAYKHLIRRKFNILIVYASSV